VHPDGQSKPARPCSMSQQTAGPSISSRVECSHASFPGKPLNVHKVECNWHCSAIREKGQGCSASCSNRAMQRGSPHRLQVFKHPMKGWCLRTMTYIQKDAFVMEYVAERVSTQRSHERYKDNPNVETYIMDLHFTKSEMHLDALTVRNHAAFAAFACSPLKANLVKRSVLTNHWDDRVPHVGFYAKREIAPGEELCYMRMDTLESSSHRNCCCGESGCNGRL